MVRMYDEALAQRDKTKKSLSERSGALAIMHIAGHDRSNDIPRKNKIIEDPAVSGRSLCSEKCG